MDENAIALLVLISFINSLEWVDIYWLLGTYLEVELLFQQKSQNIQLDIDMDLRMRMPLHC